MRIDHVPVLAAQRELQGTPRGPERFREYLRTILNDARDDVLLPPLVAANPMAKGHVTGLLDRLLAFDADGLAARAAAAAAAECGDGPGEFKASLVVIDDAGGGWTNRFDYEHGFRRPDPTDKRFWVTVPVWSSEPVCERSVAEATRAAVHRTAYVLRRGPARTLRELMAQEGAVLAAAGCTEPALDPDDLEYTRHVVEPFLGDGDLRTVVECLFGDAAARSLGFTPRGLSAWAGLALALRDARSGRSGGKQP